MTKNEWAIFLVLLARIEKTIDLIHQTSNTSLLHGATEKTAIETMQKVINRLDVYDLYIKYIQFDREASVRDLDNLLNIIKSSGEK